MRKLFQFVDQSLEAGHDVALVTLTESESNTPGSSGNMMAVLADGSICGTIGGGAVEHMVIQRAVEALQTRQSFSFEYDLGKGGELKMICGGQVKGFVNILAAVPQLIIFGAGHIGSKLAPLAELAGFRVTVVDHREEHQPLPDSVKLLHGPQDEIASQLPIGPMDYIVIVTHGHVFDYKVLRAVVERPAAYVGMIGSRRKVPATMDKLRTDGVPDEALKKVFAPIGLSITNGSPAEISVGILAEILAVKNQRPLGHMRDRLLTAAESNEQ